MAGSRKQRRVEPDQPTVSRADESSDVDGRSMAELRRMARELDVTDYDALDRDALVEAIQQGRGEERARKGGVTDSEYGTGYTDEESAERSGHRQAAPRGERERQEQAKPQDEGRRTRPETRP